MFFLARCIVCIGVVAWLVPASHGTDDWQSLADSARQAATGQVESLCGADPVSCASGGIARTLLLAHSAAERAVPARQSLDTLRPADLVPAWSGPARRT